MVKMESLGQAKKKEGLEVSVGSRSESKQKSAKSARASFLREMYPEEQMAAAGEGDKDKVAVDGQEKGQKEEQEKEDTGQAQDENAKEKEQVTEKDQKQQRKKFSYSEEFSKLQQQRDAEQAEVVQRVREEANKVKLEKKALAAKAAAEQAVRDAAIDARVEKARAEAAAVAQKEAEARAKAEAEEQAKREVEEAARKDAEEHYNLGLVCLQAEDVSWFKKGRHAVGWFTKATQRGHKQSHHMLGAFCAQCFKFDRKKCKRCKRCKVMSYCSVGCQNMTICAPSKPDDKSCAAEFANVNLAELK